MIAGSCAGIVEHCGMFPIDTIKTHVQVSEQQLSFSSVVKALYQEKGILRFYQGAQVIALGCIPSHMSYFLAYE